MLRRLKIERREKRSSLFKVIVEHVKTQEDIQRVAGYLEAQIVEDIIENINSLPCLKTLLNVLDFTEIDMGEIGGLSIVKKLVRTEIALVFILRGRDLDCTAELIIKQNLEAIYEIWHIFINKSYAQEAVKLLIETYKTDWMKGYMFDNFEHQRISNLCLIDSTADYLYSFNFWIEYDEYIFENDDDENPIMDTFTCPEAAKRFMDLAKKNLVRFKNTKRSE